MGAHLRSVLELMAYGLEVHFMLWGSIAITLAELAFTCRELGLDEAQTFSLLAGLSGKSTEPSRAFAPLVKLATERPALRRSLIERAPAEVVLTQDEQFAAAFSEFMQTHGCRALRYEVAEQNLQERPDLVIGLIADQLAKDVDPHRIDGALVARRRQAAADVRSRLTSAEDEARFDRVLARAEKAYPVREDNEYFTVSMPLALIRRAALEIGRRLADRGQLDLRDDVFQLEPGEAQAALRDGAERRDLVTRAKGEHAWVLAHPGPASYGNDPGPPPPFDSLPAEARLANEGFLWSVEKAVGPDTTRRVGADNVVSGIPASPGSYTGPVRVIRGEAEFDRLRLGDVLVCPVTSPVWSVLFPSIGALVTDTGGILSHPAIIAREYGLPAVVATGNGTWALHDGQLVTVDGTLGVVQVMPVNDGDPAGMAGQLWSGSPWSGDAVAHRVSSRGEYSMNDREVIITTTESARAERGAPVELRGIERADAAECARVIYEAFGGVHDHHRFERDFPTLQAAEQLTSALIAHPSIWGVVAESDGRIVGSNFVDERCTIRGVGPITVDPRAQGRGVGRRLMQAALERSRRAAGIRLFQDSFNVGSLSLYASLGFEVKEPAVVISGRPVSDPAAGIEVRPLEAADLQGCEDLCLKVHGFERTNELRDAIQLPTLSPFVAVRDGRISAYATTLTFFPAAHAVADTEGDMRALILGAVAAEEQPASFLLPTRQAGLFRWCLDEGLRVIKPMTYMAIGEYREPTGRWIPSILY